MLSLLEAVPFCFEDILQKRIEKESRPNYALVVGVGGRFQHRVRGQGVES